MKAYLGRAGRVLALTCFTVCALHQRAYTAPDEKSTAARWTKQMDPAWQSEDDTGKLKSAADVASQPGRGVLKGKAKGKNGELHEVTLKPLNIREFRGAKPYTADLDPAVRQEDVFVTFLLSGTPDDDPSHGTTLNIDGALIGFRLGPKDQPRTTAELVVGVRGKGNATTWEQTGAVFDIDPQKFVTTSAQFSARFHQGSGTWDLYCRNIALLKGIPLTRNSGSKPKLTLRAGRSGDMAILKDIGVGNVPGGHTLPAVNGLPDFESAFTKGDPNVSYLSAADAEKLFGKAGGQ